MEMTTQEIEVIPVPLAEAVIEVRFPGDAAVERIRGAFQGMIREQFPDLLVPRAVAGEPVASMPYVFARKDRSQAVLLSVNLLGYVVQSYPGWVRFRDAFLEHWQRLADLAPIARASRVAVRFVNRFDGQLVDVVRHSDPPPFLAPLRLDAARHEASTRFRTERGHAAHVQVLQEVTDNALALDFDVALEGLDDIEALSGALDQLHADVEDLFIASVEPRFAVALGILAEEPT